MTARNHRPSFTDYWSALRYPGSQWVSELLVAHLSREAAREHAPGGSPERALSEGGCCGRARVPCDCEKPYGEVCCTAAG